jgi:hypothetical protein
VTFSTGQNEREETTQDTIVTKSAACASYEINYVTYITATYTRTKHAQLVTVRGRLQTALRVQLSILRVQAINKVAYFWIHTQDDEIYATLRSQNIL